MGWWEIQVSDLEAAEPFYGQVFNWTFQRPMDDTYAIIANPSGEMIGALDATGNPPAG